MLLGPERSRSNGAQLAQLVKTPRRLSCSPQLWQVVRHSRRGAAARGDGPLRPAGDERRAWRRARGKATQDVRDDARAAKSSENAWRNRRRLRTPRRTTGARWTRRPRCGRELARTEQRARRASRAGALTKDLSGHNGVPRRVWGVAASLSSREKAQISYRLISLFQRVSARADACHRCARL